MFGTFQNRTLGIVGALRYPYRQGGFIPTTSISLGDRSMITSASPENATAESRTLPNKIVIVGGGFGGLYAAIRLTSLFWPKGKLPQITLIDKSDRFTFKPLLYELLNNTATEEEVAPPFSQLLAPYPVRFIQAQVSGVEEMSSGGPEGNGKVQLSDGGCVEYDWLVMAMGSQADSRGIPGVKELAVPFNVYEDAVKARTALQRIEAAGNPSSQIMIVGAGYAGVELATVVSERMKGKARVQLVTSDSDILDGCPEGQRIAASRSLAALGVEIITGCKVQRLESSTADPSSLPTSCSAQLQTADGSTISYNVDLLLWTAGSSPATREGRKGLPFPVSSRGQIEIEPTLRIRGNQRAFALGDVSRSDTDAHDDQSSPSVLPATAQVAFQQADYVAWNLWASINGRALLPFRYQHLGSMMSLGSINAAVALPVPLPLPLKTSLLNSPLGPLLEASGIKLGGNDPENGVTLEGPLAAVIRRAAYLYRQPTNEQRLNVATSWIQQALIAVGTAPASK
ncbi:hypothetical protein CEUSTIGMA_g1651.t1 [Chlamydomonas eustigma]|uniref:FAD/NAD(P)-binding domain-containing protein n=1 Tax=Chlamydomonas eustigma TaxID=1157962 RepID=A0A250WU96_9CHLO|nr:hypothetical protein CEUSTIGMA_g1651.t1 [Chlamydomonas eustigma]|eukprot:GAX74202.1 hypothetical protein CEUSTIGMA_g1651.t1 [Chlamydomonas eustigma]